jgi:hypothetical protein
VITSTDPDEDRDTALSDPPPVVITKDYDRSQTAAALSGYTAFEHKFRLWNDRVVVFVETAELERVAPDRVPEDDA